jgi:hypothetical protein
VKAHRISTEHSARIYDDDLGWFLSVGPDSDGLELCRIAYSEDGAKDREFTVPWEHAEALARAIYDLMALRMKASQTRPTSDGEAIQRASAESDRTQKDHP